MRPYSLLLGMLLCSFSAVLLGQASYQLEGQLQDENGASLPSATVVLFQLSDSSITDYMLSDLKGAFKLTGKAGIAYEVQISYLGYVPVIQAITFHQDERWPVTILKESVTTLHTAQIEADHIPVRLNGDTLEFNSGAFNVQGHDDVEALLKQLPGVDIDEQGSITVHGKRVEQITVDGKDFFGNNAQVALKNLPADAIKKVQSFDKKTDKEELLNKAATGDTKILNLVLKEDKKQGYMGNIQGGYGYNPDASKHHYEGKINLHHFNPKLRVSLIGSLNNINEAGIQFSDYNNFSGGSFSDFMDNNSMTRAANFGSPLSSLIFGREKGTNKTGTGGTSMNFFLSDKTDLSAHYLYSNISQELRTQLYNRYILENDFFTKNAITNNAFLGQNHIATAKLQQRIDSTQELHLNIRYKHQNGAKSRKENNRLFNTEGELTNQLEQEQTSQEQNNTIATSLYYQKKLKKKGRVLWFNGAFAHHDQRRDWEIFSETELYEQQLTTRDTLAQTQMKKNGEQLYEVKVAYVEPLSELVDWEWNIAAGWHLENLEQQTTNWIEDQATPNELLSDQYRKQYNYQRLMTNLDIDIKGMSYSIAAGIQRSQLRGFLFSNQQEIDQNYLFPVIKGGIITNIPKLGEIRLQYKTKIKEPRIDQLQPLLNNQNPLYLHLGNPNLVPAFQHTLSLYNFRWESANDISYHLGFWVDLTQNAIVSTQRIDEDLRTIIQPINLGNSYQVHGLGNYFGVFKKVLKYTFNANVNWSQAPILINDLERKSNTQNYGLSLSLRNAKTKIVDVNIRAKVGYLYNIIENNSSLNGATFNHSYRTKIKVTIAKRWNVSTNFDFQVFDDLNYQEQYQLALWSAEVSVLLLKDKSIKLILRGDNLLDQQFMVNRRFLPNGVIENRTNLLGRFVLLSMSYKINKMGKKEDSMDEIIFLD